MQTHPRTPILFAALALIGSACAPTDSLAPRSAAPAAAERVVAFSSDDDDDDAVKLLRCAPLAADSGAQLIGPAGGFVAVGQHRFVVPAGALDSAVLISARIGTDSLVAVKFEPSGLVFKNKARLELSTAHCTAFPSSSLLISHVDDAGTRIIESLSTNEQPQGVWAEIEHFTRYAISF